MALINGKNYDWGSINVLFLGGATTTLSAISYNENQPQPNNYGIGNEPVSFGRGLCTYDGSITIMKDEMILIEDASPNGNIFKIPPFKIKVIISDELTPTRIETLHDVRFEGKSNAMKSGDTKFDNQVKIVFSRITRD